MSALFAELGPIRFEVIGSPQGLESERRYMYAEQPIVADAPRLQWTGDGLERISFELILHATIANPALQAEALRIAAESHQAMPLVFGNGTFRGMFVVVAIATRAAQLDAGGAPVALRLRLDLKEWPTDAVWNPAVPPAAPFTPLGLLAVSGAASASATSIIPAGLTPLAAIPPPTAPATVLQQPGDIPVAAITRSMAL